MDMVSTFDRFRQEREDHQATEILRSESAFYAAIVPRLCLPSGFLASRLKRRKHSGRTRRGGARRRVAQKDEELCEIRFSWLFTVLSAIRETSEHSLRPRDDHHGLKCHRLGAKGLHNGWAAGHRLSSGADTGMISGLAGPGHWQWS
jgi:hypothetical protein